MYTYLARSAAFLFLCIGFFIISHPAEAATELSGIIDVDTTLTTSLSPYHFQDVLIATGTTMTIEPGVVVQFYDQRGIEVAGTLRALGTVDAPVRFTSVHDTTFNGGTTTPNSNQHWNEIAFLEGSVGYIEHAIITYGSGYFKDNNRAPAVYNDGGFVTVRNTLFDHNQIFSVGQMSGELLLEESVVANNSTVGVIIFGGDATLRGTTFTQNSKAVYSQGVDDLLLQNNTFIGNETAVMAQYTYARSLKFENNVAVGGKFNGIVVRGPVVEESTLLPGTLPYFISSGGSVWRQGAFAVTEDSNLTIADTGRLTVAAGAVIKMTDTANIEVAGSLILAGAPDNQVILTSLYDNTIGSASWDTDNTEPTPGSWGDITVLAGGDVSLDHAVVQYAGEGRYNSGGAFYNTGGELYITNSTLKDNSRYGIQHVSGTSTITDSSIAGHTQYGVYNRSTSVIDATNNYWGDPSGPRHKDDNLDGLGDGVSDYVDFHPWTGLPTCMLTAAPAEIHGNETVTLVWESNYADSVFIDQGIGTTTVSGEMSIAVATTTTYTLTATSAYGQASCSATVTVSEPVIDPLIMQYLPILYFHEDEMYYPMNVEAYVEASALWDDRDLLTDTLIKAYSTTSPVTLDDINVPSSEDWYLAFSDPDTAKSINLSAAHKKYSDLQKLADYATTTYAHRMNATTTDGRPFIVLQYWYFYAMNNWGEMGGYNNHEGDWESIFIFLDANTKMPKYVAFSSHLNDGNPDWNATQYTSVLRTWDAIDVSKEGDRIYSFVSLGSHAVYGEEGNISVMTLDGLKKDQTEGSSRLEEILIKTLDVNLPGEYFGKWGADDVGLIPGNDGPISPQYSTIGGTNRYLYPLKWSGIEKFAALTILEPVTTVPFIEQGIVFDFTNPLQPGDTLSVEPYAGPITFGFFPDGTQSLPGYWEFDSSLTNGSFSVDVTFTFSTTTIAAYQSASEQVRVGYYNDSTNTWELLTSTLVSEDAVSTTLTHFSRYALFIVPQSEESTDLFEQLRAKISETDMRSVQKKTMSQSVDRIEQLYAKDTRGTLAAVKVQLKILATRIALNRALGIISDGQAAELLGLVERIQQLNT